MQKGLSDLDELILRCRDDRAKIHIAEAVACYKAGAFRFSIAATWVAVVFDVVHKLEEMELTGDKNARSKLQHFKDIRKAHDLPKSLEFERDLQCCSLYFEHLRLLASARKSYVLSYAPAQPD